MLRTTNSELNTVNSKGFTLIEIIVLIVVAGIILPVIVVPFATGIRGSGKPEMATTAMYLAHQKMEEFMKFYYRRAELNPTTLTGWVPVTIGGVAYDWQWEILYVDKSFNVLGNGIDPPNDRRYKRIRVQVRDPGSAIYEIYSVVTSFP
jgi:type II secretory pathway pseudopilin PulG